MLESSPQSYGCAYWHASCSPGRLAADSFAAATACDEQGPACELVRIDHGAKVPTRRGV